MANAAGADSAVTDEVLHCRAFLSRVAEPANIPLWAFVSDVGPVAAVAQILSDDLSDDVRSAVASRRSTVDPATDLDAARRHDIRLVVPESEDWPHFAFACLEHAARERAATYGPGHHTHLYSGEPIPPLALWVKGAGDLASLATRSVGIVGARACTMYGSHIARRLARELAEAGFVVVSGGAYGIDAAAHRGALDAGAQTVIISAGGADTAYPSGNDSLFRHVIRNGLVVSESPPGAVPQRRRFLTRNRLVAALSTGTVMVEAARRSGAANTLAHSVRLGRPVMAVPGPVDSVMSAGCHDALRREEWGTRLVTGVNDVLEVIGSATDLPSPTTFATTAGVDRTRVILDELEPDERYVFDALPADRGVGVDELVVSSGLAPGCVLRSLPSLEAAGLVSRDEDGLWSVLVGRRRRPGTA
ncbi:MAG: DNA-processing protein DprA [Jatrophihabitans sp.]